MTITAAFVLFAVIWFMTFFCVLPIGTKTQGEAGKVEPGTPAGAPSGPEVARKAKITTMIAVVLWAIIGGIILSGVISVRDFDVMNRMPAVSTDGTDG